MVCLCLTKRAARGGGKLNCQRARYPSSMWTEKQLW
jgi:hypothetical protein